MADPAGEGGHPAVPEGRPFAVGVGELAGREGGGSLSLLKAFCCTVRAGNLSLPGLRPFTLLRHVLLNQLPLGLEEAAHLQMQGCF